MLKIKHFLSCLLIVCLTISGLYAIKTDPYGLENKNIPALKNMLQTAKKQKPGNAEMVKAIQEKIESLQLVGIHKHQTPPPGMVLVTAAQAEQLKAAHQLPVSTTLPSGMVSITKEEYAALLKLQSGQTAGHVAGGGTAGGTTATTDGSGEMKRGTGAAPRKLPGKKVITQAQATQVAIDTAQKALGQNPSVPKGSLAKSIANAVKDLYGADFKESPATTKFIAVAIVAAVNAIGVPDVILGLREVISDEKNRIKAAGDAVSAAIDAINTQAATTAKQIVTTANPSSSNADKALLIAKAVTPIYQKIGATLKVTPTIETLAASIANVIVANISNVDKDSVIAALTQVLPSNTAGTIIATAAGNALRVAAKAAADQAVIAAQAAEQSGPAWQAGLQAGLDAAQVAKNNGKNINEQALAAGVAAAQKAKDQNLSEQGIVTIAAVAAHKVSEVAADAAKAAAAAVDILPGAAAKSSNVRKSLWSQALIPLGLGQMQVIELNQYAPKQVASAPVTPTSTPSGGVVSVPSTVPVTKPTPVPVVAAVAPTTAQTTDQEMLAVFQKTKLLRTDPKAFDAWMHGNITKFAQGSYGNLTALHAALLLTTNLEIVLDILFANSTALDKVDDKKQTPLHILLSTYKGNDLHKALLSNFITPGSISAANNAGQTPLHGAIARLIKAFQAQKQTPTKTAMAEFSAWVDVATMLTRRGASKAAVDSNGNTPLMMLEKAITNQADKSELGAVFQLLA